MAIGTVSSSPDTVGVAVVNYRVPFVHTKEEVLKNCESIADRIDELKRGYPGLDLIIFPEYSTQGFHPTKWLELSTTVPGPETEIFSAACRRNNVWGIFSITGELNSLGNPWNSLVIINNMGEIILNYHKVNPWVPKEPWYPGNKTSVVKGPKGINMGGIICNDIHFPEICRDLSLKGAELIVCVQGYMQHARDHRRMVAQVRALENLSYLAVSNLSGQDLTCSFSGHSCIVDFDGSLMAECDSKSDQVIYALLPINSIRDARVNWTMGNPLVESQSPRKFTEGG